MNVRPIAAVILAGAALALTGCSPPLTVQNPFVPAPVPVVVDAATAAPVALAKGQTLVVNLDANVTTGLRWEATPGYEPTLMQVGTADFAAPPAPPPPRAAGDKPGKDGSVAVPAPAAAVAPGTPGVMTFLFLAANPGTTTLELGYRRPFEPDVVPAKTVRYDVTVR